MRILGVTSRHRAYSVFFKRFRVIAVAALSLCVASQALGDFYSIDGSGNNEGLTRLDWGSTNIHLLREASGAHYSDGISAPAGSGRPSPRQISSDIFDQPASLPNSRNLSDMVWLWGQFIDHDIDLTGGADPAEPLNIAVPIDDPYFDPGGTGTQEIDFNRSTYDPATGTAVGNPRQQPNQITAWLDGSNIYGSDIGRAAWLRSGVGGRLKTSAHATGDLLPFNDGTQANAGGPSTDLFVAGDVRANEQSALTAMHTLWMREHNRLADEIAAVQTTWTDPQIFDEARSIVIAQVQSITYNEWMPALLGPGAIATYSGYKDYVNPGISNAFSTAAYRIGHTMVSPTLLRQNDDGSTIPDGHLALRDAFFSPDRILDEGGIDPLLFGLCDQLQQTIDAKLIDDLRNFLFGPPGSGGFDLASLNIQRGRDHGLADYNTLRQDYGLSPVTTVAEITGDVDAQLALIALYGNVNNIDPWVGGLLEEPFGDSALGELFHTVLVDQFTRIRDGDRFWYENLFEGNDLTGFQSVTLTDLIIRNTGITQMPLDLFVIPEPATLTLLLLAGSSLLGRHRAV